MTVAGKFQSTLPAGGATASTELFSQATTISIHAPRGGSDAGNPVKVLVILISIHAPRGGSDSLEIPTYLFPFGFQSTLPAGGATRSKFQHTFFRSDFNPRSPRGERPSFPLFLICLYIISIHAPRGGSDNFPIWRCVLINYFNPRSPRGERLEVCNGQVVPVFISIHAPRGGSDFSGMRL